MSTQSKRRMGKASKKAAEALQRRIFTRRDVLQRDNPILKWLHIPARR